MALQFYLEIDGIKGDCQDSEHAGHLDVSDWNVGMHHPSNVKQGGSTATGKTSFTDMSVTTHLDNAAPDLFGKVSSGDHVPKATLKCYKGAGSGRVNYLKIKLENIADLREKFEKKIRNQEWPIDMLMKTDTLQDSLDKYKSKIAGSARNRNPAARRTGTDQKLALR